MEKNIRKAAIDRLIELNYNETTAPNIVDEVLRVFSNFHPQEIKNVLIEHGDLKIHTAMKEVFFNGKKIDLTGLEYRGLEFFVKNTGSILTYQRLFAALWGNTAISDDNIRVLVMSLRKKLCPDIIKTRPGFGYYMPRLP